MKLRHTTGLVYAHLLSIEGRRRQIICMDTAQVDGLHINPSYEKSLTRYAGKIKSDEVIDLGVFIRSLDLVEPRDRPEMAEVTFLASRPYDYRKPEAQRNIRD